MAAPVCLQLYRLYSVLSLTLKLEHHSRENGWRVSGVGLTGVWVKFSIGIHYLHWAFPQWSDTRKCKNVIREVFFLRAWKRYVWKCWHCTKIFWNVKHWFSKYQLNNNKYLWGQLANLDQILYEAALGWGKGCIRFWDRLDQNFGFYGNRLLMGKTMSPPFLCCFLSDFFFKLAGNKDRHKISDEFEFRPDQTTPYKIRCP